MDLKKIDNYLKDDREKEDKEMQKKAEKAEKELRKYAKEAIKCEYIGGTLYAFGSELATLRLYKTYISGTRFEKVDQGFSKNMKKWYFRSESGF